MFFFTGGSCGKSSTFTYYHFRSIFHLCNSKLKLLLNNDKYIHYNLADVFILFICIINFLIASQNISFTFESCFQQRSYMVQRANNRKIIQLIFRNIRSLCLMKYPWETLQNLPCFRNMQTGLGFCLFFIWCYLLDIFP